MEPGNREPPSRSHCTGSPTWPRCRTTTAYGSMRATSAQRRLRSVHMRPRPRPTYSPATLRWPLTPAPGTARRRQGEQPGPRHRRRDRGLERSRPGVLLHHERHHSQFDAPAGYATRLDGGSVTDGGAMFRAGGAVPTGPGLNSPTAADGRLSPRHRQGGDAQSTTFYVDPEITLT